MKRQRGQAFILVLILLAIGALMLSPVLRLVTTGLYGQRISEDALAGQYGADAALENALQQILNGLMGNLTQSGSSVGYDFTYGTSKYPIIITVPTVPDTPLGDYGMKYLQLQVSPNFLNGTTGNYTTSYVIGLENQPWGNDTRTNFEVTLPKGLTYIANSTWSTGPTKQAQLNLLSLDPSSNWPPVHLAASVNFTAHTAAGFTMTQSPGLGSGGTYYELTTDPGSYPRQNSYLITTYNTDGSQHLKYVVSPSPNNLGNASYILTFQVSGKPPGGISYAIFSASFGGTATATNVQTAALGVAFYTITLNIEGVTYKVIIAFDSATGTMKIISYERI